MFLIMRKREGRKPLSFCTSTSTPPFVNGNVTKKMQKTLDRELDMSYISNRAKRKAHSLTKEHKMKIGNYELTEDEFFGKKKIEGDLNLRSLTSIPDGFNPTVVWSLNLNSLTSIPDGFAPTVGGNLYLDSLTSIPDGFNPTVGWSLALSSLTSIPYGFNPTVGGYLDLSALTSIPDGFNPTVGWHLYLDSLTSIHEGFNPNVGGKIYTKNDF